MVPEPVLEVESEEEYLVTRMDEFGRSWSRSEVFLGRWFLHDTSDGVVWWDERGWGWRGFQFWVVPLHASVYGGSWMNFCTPCTRNSHLEIWYTTLLGGLES